MRLRLVLPRGRGRAGLGSLKGRPWLAAVALLAALTLGGCGAHATSKGAGSRTAAPAAPAPRGPAFGLTEDNANLLYSTAHPPSSDARIQAARERLNALHPRYLRLLVDWAKLQPQAGRPPALVATVDGCARSVGPCVGYAGIREELAAIATQQRAARAEGRPSPEVVLDVFGTPAWAARPASGCELADTHPFSRPITAQGLSGYRALIGALLALGAREGVALEWWAPWNEPNDAVFVSPQRAFCAASSPTLAAAVYAQLVRAMSEQLAAVGGEHHLLLGELNAFPSDSPHRTSISSFVAALPASVVCLSDVWSIHAYASYGEAKPQGDPVAALEDALDARGDCGRRAHIWVTESGAGAPHPGRPRPPSVQDEREGCITLAGQLAGWVADTRVQAIFQYTLREDPAFPVGLLSADLAHVYPAYRLWLLYTRASANGDLPPSQPASCA